MSRYSKLPLVQQTIDKVRDLLGEERRHMADCFEQCFLSNLNIAAEEKEDGSIFLVTGDIPAMWLRDSACQVRPYLHLAGKEAELASLIAGVIRQQMKGILLDPYANAFNDDGETYTEWTNDLTEMKEGVWEHKFEIDSLCYPVQCSYLYWKETGRTDIFDDKYRQAVQAVYDTFRREQKHETDSGYSFVRPGSPYVDSLSRNGKGALVNPDCGLIWSGFRPSDDACVYGYLIPSNMFAAVILEELAEIAEQIYGEKQFAEDCLSFSAEIRSAIDTYAIPPCGSARFDMPYYAYEVDGYGQYLIMDDANFPNLLSAPYLGYCSPDDPVYRNTRKKIFTEENPYYYHGSAASGMGSIHTRPDYVWPLSLGMYGLTSADMDEKWKMADMMTGLDAGSCLMHESVDVNDPQEFTRPLFGWANAVFCELVMQCLGLLPA